MPIVMWMVIGLSLYQLAREFTSGPESQEDFDAIYQQGYDAAMEGKSCFTNPHRGVFADVWADGFAQAKQWVAPYAEDEAWK